MMTDYKGLAIFVKVVECGSFSEAGRRLKLSTSVISHHVSNLEAHIGVSLLHRSTRSISLTPEGHKIFASAKRMVAAGDEALDALSDDSDQPVGALHITMPIFGEKSPIHRAIWSFAREHPLVAIKFHASDELVDVIKGGFDIAIRYGQLKDSTLKTRKLSKFSRVLIASPDYFAGRPAIKTPRDLAECDFIAFTMLPEKFSLQKGRETVEIAPQNVRVEVNTVTAAKTAALSGLGIQRMPNSEIESELRKGRLVRVLPDWELADLGIYAVWPESGPQRMLTRRFIDFLVVALAND